MSSVTTDIEVRNYMAAVAAELADLPDEERSELMSDLESHLHEVAAEGNGSLFERLGAASAYAAELRSSAGLPEKGDAPSGSVVTRALSVAREWRDRFRASKTGAYLSQLAPAWWVLRAYLGVVVLDYFFFTQPSQRLGFFPSFAGSEILGIGVVIGAVLVSVALAKRTDPIARRASAAWTLAAVVLGLPALGALSANMQQAVYYDEAATIVPELHHEDGTGISNLCAYDGKLRNIKKFLLFDQDGRPVDNVGAPQYWTEGTPSGRPFGSGFPNLFPQPQRLENPMTGETSTFKCPTTIEEAPAKR